MDRASKTSPLMQAVQYGQSVSKKERAPVFQQGKRSMSLPVTAIYDTDYNMEGRLESTFLKIGDLMSLFSEGDESNGFISTLGQVKSQCTCNL